MKAVRVRNLIIGEERPGICVPIVGRTKAEIIEQTKLCLSAEADMVEWHADWFEQVEDSDAVQEMLITLRNIVKEMPVLFTFRTKNEGGEKEMEPTALFDTYSGNDSNRNGGSCRCRSILE